MTRLSSALSLLLLCSTSVYAAEPQRQGLRALEEATVGPSTTAPTEDATADGSTEAPTGEDSTISPTGEDSTISPTGEDSTISPTGEDSTISPTGEDSTISPTGEDSTISPSEDASTIVPSTLAPTDPPKKTTDAPTESPIVVTDAPSEEDEITDGPTEAPTADMTLSPTEAGVDTRSDDLDCSENPATHTVMVDLRIEFQDDAVVQCTPGEEQFIGAVISQTMNDAFPDVVESWDGAAQFHSFEFDDQQFVDDISEVTNGRMLRGRMMEAAKRLAAKRRRADVFACPLRGDYACPSGYCMWGCVDAATTNCGDDDSTEEWSDLAQEVKKELKKLKYDCLGNPGKFDVMVTLEPGNEELTVRTFDTDAPTDPPRAFEDKGEVVPITTTLFLNYFKGQGGDLTGHTEVEAQLMEELNQFVERVVYAKDEYAPTFNGMNEGSLIHSWDEATRTLTLKFSTNIYFTELDGETDHDLARVITKDGDFHIFLKKLREHACEGEVDQAECSQWMRGIHSVVFQGTGTGRRLVEVFAEEEA